MYVFRVLCILRPSLETFKLYNLLHLTLTNQLPLDTESAGDPVQLPLVNSLLLDPLALATLNSGYNRGGNNYGGNNNYRGGNSFFSL